MIWDDIVSGLHPFGTSTLSTCDATSLETFPIRIRSKLNLVILSRMYLFPFSSHISPRSGRLSCGYVFSFEWHHKHRGNDDQVIDSSHKGAGLVYISPNPPQDKSWVKIQQEGLLSSGQWYVTGKHTERKGK